MDISGKLAQVNGRLRSGRVGVTVEQNGSKLRLRATLPPKPGSKKERPFQQRIATGLPANLAGLRAAEKEARLVGAQLAAGEFAWNRYQKNGVSSEQKPCADWVAEFKKYYLANGGIDPTWRMDYHKIYKHLPPESPLTVEVLKALVLRTKPNTKTRVRACTAARKLGQWVTVIFISK